MKTRILIPLCLLAIATGGALADTPEPGWLGVSLDVGTDAGVPILGVVPRSPAAETGLRVGDVIVGVDAQNVTSSDGVASTLRSNGAGAITEIRFLRDGVLQTAQVTLAAAPHYSRVTDPDRVRIHDVIRSGKVVEVAPNGDMLIRELDGTWAGALPDAVVELIGDQPHKIDTVTSIDDGQMRVHTRYHIDGQEVEIVEQADGIRVLRDGDEQVYADRDELAEDDPQAADALRRHRHLDHFFSPDQNEVAFFPGPEGGHVTVDLQRSDPHSDDNVMFGHANVALDPNRPRRTFRVGPRGTIEVTVIRGENKLVREYRDADDLRDRDFDLYLHYDRLLQATRETDP